MEPDETEMFSCAPYTRSGQENWTGELRAATEPTLVGVRGLTSTMFEFAGEDTG
jgi:hypothetical protein